MHVRLRTGLREIEWGLHEQSEPPESFEQTFGPSGAGGDAPGFQTSLSRRDTLRGSQLRPTAYIVSQILSESQSGE